MKKFIISSLITSIIIGGGFYGLYHSYQLKKEDMAKQKPINEDFGIKLWEMLENAEHKQVIDSNVTKEQYLLKNTSGEDLSYLGYEYDIFDKNGIKIESKTMYESNIPKNQEFLLEASYGLNENADRIEFVHVEWDFKEE